MAVIGISYDPIDVLRTFSEKQGITYPLLSDKGSKVIRQMGLLNQSIASTSPVFGVPNPGLYIVDHKLVIRHKQFEKSFTARPNVGSILALSPGSETYAAGRSFRTEYLSGSIAVSDTVAYPGQPLTVEVRLYTEGDFHLYVRPVPEGYIPLTIELLPNPDVTLDAFPMPDSKEITLDSPNETFNVVSGDIVLKSTLRTSARAHKGKTVLRFEIKLQSCNTNFCFPPKILRLMLPITIIDNQAEGPQ